MKQSFADILGSLDRDRDRRLAAKLPSWAGVTGLRIPRDLALQQCSGEAAARHKADLAADWLSQTGEASDGAYTVADITGGLGVDSWAFSGIVSRVLYNERDAELCEAAGENFRLLGVSNIECSCNEAEAFLESLPEVDLIYADPARRDAAGRKVFLLEDCSPDILELLPLIFRKTPRLMLKLSPMADISMLEGRFAPYLREVHVIGDSGECKELLCLLCAAHNQLFPTRRNVSPAPQRSRAIDCEPLIVAGPMIFNMSEERAATPTMLDRIPAVGETLLVPSPVIMKAGCFRLLSARYPLAKLDPDIHLYTVTDENCHYRLSELGELCRIIDLAPLSKETIREFGKRYPRAAVTARGIPGLSSEQLRSRLGCAEGSSLHIRAVTAAGSRLLLATAAD